MTLKSYIDKIFNVKQITEMKEVGHFSALEKT